ncbi:STAS domain-containing protein [Streptomyces mutabilis]|uniref:STAS domain-containing protein n=1 Tax=Streptomyces TaxID=1883 RepID=UPI0039856FCB
MGKTTPIFGISRWGRGTTDTASGSGSPLARHAFEESVLLFPCHRLTEDQIVIQIDDAIDFNTEDVAHGHLCGKISRSAARTVIIDVQTPLVTATAVSVLLRTRQFAYSRGAVLCVVARRSLARRVFRTTGVCRYLRVAATLPGAVRLTRGCPPLSEPPTRQGDGALA